VRSNCFFSKSYCIDIIVMKYTGWFIPSNTVSTVFHGDVSRNVNNENEVNRYGMTVRNVVI